MRKEKLGLRGERTKRGRDSFPPPPSRWHRCTKEQMRSEEIVPMRVTRVGPHSSFSSPGIETAESRACDKKAQIAVPQNWNGPQRPGNTLATSPAPSLFANCFLQTGTISLHTCVLYPKTKINGLSQFSFILLILPSAVSMRHLLFCTLFLSSFFFAVSPPSDIVSTRDVSDIGNMPILRAKDTGYSPSVDN